VSLLAILSIWAVVFYFDMLEEVKETIDDGLDNYKMLIIYKAQEDSTFLQPETLSEKNYVFRQISPEYASQITDTYKDTLIHFERTDRNELLRLLTSAFAANDGKYYELKVVSPIVNKGELITKLLYSLVWLYLVILLSMIVVNKLVLQRVWKPFYNLLEQLETFKLGAAPVLHPGKLKIREFKILNDTISDLLKRNQETFNSQKQFIENASHELQTPLAISINKLELLAENGSRSEEDVEVISNIIKTLEGLSRLNKSLLLLSKIENKQFVEEHDIHFTRVIEKLIDDFADLAEFKKVDISFEKKGEWSCRMNTGLAEILAMNLIKNAIIHNHAEGRVIITTTSNSFRIENTGAAEPMDPDKMFERFYKKSTDTGSTGLGLAIVKAITTFYGLTLKYTYTGRHTITVTS
jgi:signal transduction histidine kinase